MAKYEKSKKSIVQDYLIGAIALEISKLRSNLRGV
jgi:hypothetical protein